MSTTEPPGLVQKVIFLRKSGTEVTFSMSAEGAEYFKDEGASYLGQFWRHADGLPSKD